MDYYGDAARRIGEMRFASRREHDQQISRMERTLRNERELAKYLVELEKRVQALERQLENRERTGPLG